MLTMAGRLALLIVAATFVGFVVAALSADGHARRPTIIERIMGPIVRQIQLSQIGGPMKQPLLDSSPLSVRKVKMEPSGAQGDSVGRQSGDNARRQPGNHTANSESVKSQAGPSNDGNYREAPRRDHPPASSVVVTRGSGHAERPSAYSPVSREVPRLFRYIRYFLDNFKAAPPMMNPDMMPPPLPPLVAGTAASKTADKGYNRSDGKGVGRINVHYEAFVISNVRRNASTLGKKNATVAARSRALRSPLFLRRFHSPCVRHNRSASRKVHKHPVDLLLAAGSKAAESSSPVRNGGVGNLRHSASFSCRCCGLKARVALLLVLLVVLSVLLARSLHFFFASRKPSKIGTKCVGRLRDCTEEEKGRGVINL